MIKYGKTIIPYGVFPEKHEIEVATILNKFGRDVEFLIPSQTKNSRTPDIKMDNLFWEIKSPKGNSSRTIENNLRIALKQSANIIVDLRRMKFNEQKAIMQIEKEFKFRKNISKIIVIKKNQILLDMIR